MAGLVLFVQAIIDAALGQYAVALFNFSYACLIYWLYTGPAFIEFPLCLRILSSMDSAHFANMDRRYTLGVRLWRVLPIFKGSGYLRMLTNQSLVRLLQGDYDGAEAPIAEALSIISSRKSLRNSQFAAIVLNNMACLQLRKDELAEGEKLAMQALEIHRRGRSPGLCAFPLINLGWLRLKQHRPVEAEEYLREANKLFAGKLPMGILKPSVTYASTNGLIMLADALYQQDKTEEANKVCDGLIGSLAKDSSCMAITSVMLLTNLADTLMERNELSRAEKLLEYTYDLVRQFPVHPDSQPLLLSYTQLLSITDRKSELEDLKSWVRPVLLNPP